MTDQTNTHDGEGVEAGLKEPLRAYAPEVEKVVREAHTRQLPPAADPADALVERVRVLESALRRAQPIVQLAGVPDAIKEVAAALAPTPPTTPADKP